MTTSTVCSAEKSRVLVIDDHASARESMADVLRQAGHEVDAVASASEALRCVSEASYDVVLTDLRMPGLSGLDFLREMEGRDRGPQIIMVTAHASVATAVEAVRRGAFDYIEKPFEAGQLESLVARAIEQGRLWDRDRARPAARLAEPCMVGSCRKMQEFRERIARVAATDETVLIIGESGTGKELAARAIHSQSRRACRPLVSLNCPVLSAHLMESELFGHERGAFTGAVSSRAGRFELANGGTILLDEITEIPVGLQAKLLRVLQERTFERVGSSVTRAVDVRVLAATNRDLYQEVSQGRFREDLYYRLAVLPLEVPPLRDRREDVDELVAHIQTLASARTGCPPCYFSTSAMELLRNYHWPGNVRELENVVTRANVLHSGMVVEACDVRPWLIDRCGRSVGRREASLPVGMSLQEMERAMIEATLAHFDGHRAKTAQALGIGLRTLTGKLREYGYAPRGRRLAG